MTSSNKVYQKNFKVRQIDLLAFPENRWKSKSGIKEGSIINLNILNVIGGMHGLKYWVFIIINGKVRFLLVPRTQVLSKDPGPRYLDPGLAISNHTFHNFSSPAYPGNLLVHRNFCHPGICRSCTRHNPDLWSMNDCLWSSNIPFCFWSSSMDSSCFFSGRSLRYFRGKTQNLSLLSCFCPSGISLAHRNCRLGSCGGTRHIEHPDDPPRNHHDEYNTRTYYGCLCLSNTFLCSWSCNKVRSLCHRFLACTLMPD